MNIAYSSICLGNCFSLISPVSQLDIGYPPNNTNQATLPGKFLKKSELCVNSAIGSKGGFAIQDWFYFLECQKKKQEAIYSPDILLKAQKELTAGFSKVILGRCKILRQNLNF